MCVCEDAQAFRCRHISRAQNAISSAGIGNSGKGHCYCLGLVLQGRTNQGSASRGVEQAKPEKKLISQFRARTLMAHARVMRDWPGRGGAGEQPPRLSLSHRGARGRGIPPLPRRYTPLAAGVAGLRSFAPGRPGAPRARAWRRSPRRRWRAAARSHEKGGLAQQAGDDIGVQVGGGAAVLIVAAPARAKRAQAWTAAPTSAHRLAPHFWRTQPPASHCGYD